jgi:uncharacterized lipoprotein NlpE involved in copper resistance
MNQKLIFTGIIIILLLFSCNNQRNKVLDSNVIDIEGGMLNLTRFKVSDFGKTIRYIPLETTDEALVGRNPVVKVLKNYIVVEDTQRNCLLFNKQDGSFISSIGRIGQGPDDYTDCFSWTDEKEEFLYFERKPNQLVKYDMKGNFSGRIEFSSPAFPSYFLLTDSEIIGYYGGVSQHNPLALGLFDKEGNLNDTIPQFTVESQAIITPSEIAAINVLRAVSHFGIWTMHGVIMIDYKNDTRQIYVPKATKIWRNNGVNRFKEDFVDTLYTVSDKKLIPSFVFHTGKYHWPIEETTSKRNTNERIFVAYVSENEDYLFFQCVRGMYSGEPDVYNGLYDKKTGATRLGKNSEGIEDDLTHFMPFTPLGMSTVGEFISLVEVDALMEWKEKHPEALNNDKLSFLKTLDEDMNPIVIIVE